MKNRMIALSIILTSLALTACGEASAAGTVQSVTDAAPESSAESTEQTVFSPQNTEPEKTTSAAEPSSLPDTTSAADSTTKKESETTVSETETSASETAETTTSAAGISTALDVAAEMGKKIPVSNITAMAAAMIGAEEGVSFKVDGNKFEVYKFAPGDAKLKEAESGHLTVTLQGFGAVSSKCSVNGVFVMMYETPNDDVIKAFKDVRSE